MTCVSPIVLKNGLCVPCGKCDICRSNARNEWSIRLAIHLAKCDYMPMFITLTYDDAHLPRICPSWKDFGRYGSCTHDCFACHFEKYCFPTVWRDDVSKFLKAYKRKYGLKNNDFQYFGCCEYGENTRRPHAHLLFFGDTELYQDFFESTEKAQARVNAVWTFGNTFVGVAGFDGIHYCTKYCLKDDLELLHPSQVRPFTIASNGLGMNFLDSDIGKKIKSQLDYCQRNKDKILAGCPDFSLADKSSIKTAIDYLGRFLPRFMVILDDGRKVFLPRSIRKKLVGSFEYFKDSPYWLWIHLNQLYDSIQYYDDFGEFDSTHDINHCMELCNLRIDKIRKRYLENKYNKHLKL